MKRKKAAGSKHSVDDMTEVQAGEHLKGRSGAVPCDHVVLVVSEDQVFWCSSAYHEQLGPWHFVWTLCNGNHFYPADKILKIHVTSPESSYETNADIGLIEISTWGGASR